jgi:hypothetical protein
MIIITRKEAKEKGINRYFTGIPCKNGHVAERTVSEWKCIECSRLRCKKDRRNHYNKRREAEKSYVESHQEDYRVRSKEYYHDHKNERTLYNKQWYEDNKIRIIDNWKEKYYANIEYYLSLNKENYQNRKDKLQEQFMEIAPNIQFLDVINESIFEKFIAGIIINHFNIDVFSQYYISPSSRIDLFIPELKIGIEVKYESTIWDTKLIETQISKYKHDLGSDYKVYCVSLTGKYGISLKDLLITLQIPLETIPEYQVPSPF